MGPGHGGQPGLSRHRQAIAGPAAELGLRLVLRPEVPEVGGRIACISRRGGGGPVGNRFSGAAGTLARLVQVTGLMAEEHVAARLAGGRDGRCSRARASR